MRARDNPFRSERLLSIRYCLQRATWPELLQRCHDLNYRAALVGPCGSGKTTLLEDLESRLPELGFKTRLIRLDAEHPQFEPGFLKRLATSLDSQVILLFDGAEQLNPLAWCWFKWRTRAAGGLIIALHRAGRLPMLWECQTSQRLLAEIAAQLLESDPLELLPQAEVFFARHCGNLREALRDWYFFAAAI
jgi:hypothetical protein